MASLEDEPATAPERFAAVPSDQPRAPARHAAWKIVLTVLVAASSLGGLLWASTREGAEYYKFVDEVTADAARLAGKRLRVHGHVVADSIVAAKGSLRYRFRIESRAPRTAAAITAEFHGIPPDTFKDGAEVIAAGTLSADGALHADRIETKCPSKYEAK
jgi:cytochrome c-type biogenesis protein CcmE